jgi:hypothetical protein
MVIVDFACQHFSLGSECMVRPKRVADFYLILFEMFKFKILKHQKRKRNGTWEPSSILSVVNIMQKNIKFM